MRGVSSVGPPRGRFGHLGLWLLRLRSVALGIFLDAFVKRTLLVSALVLPIGRVGFWPAKVHF